MSSHEEETLRRQIIFQALSEESEEVREIVDRFIESEAFPDLPTTEQKARALAKMKERIRLERADDAVQSGSGGSQATTSPLSDVAPALPRDGGSSETGGARPPTPPEVALAASTSGQERRAFLDGVITGPDGRDQQVRLKVIEHSPDLKLIECLDFVRIAEELGTTDLGLFVSGKYVAAFDPSDHFAEVPAGTVARAEKDQAEVRVAPNPQADS